ncbi:MAG: thioredoxin family protein [Myroides sp.]|nr:thioredoxin family protein [Myroides sp.]
MQSIFQKAIENSMSYNDYLSLIDEKISQNASTGHEQTELLTDFTKLNRARMKRLDKTQQILPELEKAVQAITVPQTWLVLTESWCGDAAQHVPVFNKLSIINPLIDLRLVLRDDNDELMQKYLTNGGRSIPKVIALTADCQELFTWGPRPATAQVEVKRLLDQEGGFNDAVKEGIQIWYNNDKGVSLQNELIDLLKTLK